MDFEALRKKLEAVHGANFDYALIERAYRFAEEAHAGQMRKSGEPYMTHPLAVAAKLADWGLDAPTITAALLHDVAEDTPYTRKDIAKHFSEEVAFLVDAVTKLKRIRYTDAAEHHAENLRKMVLAFAEDIRVVLIKLVDRLHDMETISVLPLEAQKRIAHETIEIYAPLANRLGIGEAKGQLEDLAFPIVHPEEYPTLRAMVAEPVEERKAFVELAIPQIRERLIAEGVRPLDLHARAKHWYSLWQKLKRYDMNLGEIHDLVAVRIIVPSVEQCYAALGAIHAAWPPLPGRIKDFVALPKPNGYRSLHTTVFGPEGKVIEIQIRTPEMHAEAEGGIASHWAYEDTKGTEAYRRRLPAFARMRELAWVKQLSEWQKHIQDPKEFLESIRIDFFRNRIFVFTPKGDVIDLPEGATPVDFAYHIHSDIGDAAVGAKVNGKMTALDHELKNADIVEILTQKNKKPSRDWLGFVKTSLARKHIRSSLRHAYAEAKPR